MTSMALTADYAAFLDDRSQSAAGAAVRNQLHELRVDETATVTLGQRARAKDALGEAVEEASSANWMGPGSLPANAQAVRNALLFLDLLPATFPAPTVAAEPDGEIEIEWYGGPRNVFSVSIGPSNALHYAGLFGRSESHGIEYLAGEIPEQILELARRALA